jgi:hypothetical protein
MCHKCMEYVHWCHTKNCEKKLEDANEYGKMVPKFYPDGVKLTGDLAF